MTGENFLRINRHNDKLDEMRARYYKLCGESQETLNSQDYERYNLLHSKVMLLAEDIWAEAFYTFGRDWNMATAYCKRYSIG